MFTEKYNKSNHAEVKTVFAGVPHHITQRGNRREDVFYTDENRKVYLVKRRCALCRADRRCIDNKGLLEETV